jgi:hypothetical protein
MEEFFIPWKNDRDLYVDNENDSYDTALRLSSSTRTPSVASTSSSSVRMDSSRKNLRYQTTSNYPMSKRQRKTTD